LLRSVSLRPKCDDRCARRPAGAAAHLVEAWILDDFTDPRANELKAGGFYISQETHWLYDCTEGGSATTEIIRYSQHMGAGLIVDKGLVSKEPQTLERAPAPSVAASRLAAVCEIAAKLAPAAAPNETTAGLTLR
jgi:hypothetical protein